MPSLSFFCLFQFNDDSNFHYCKKKRSQSLNLRSGMKTIILLLLICSSQILLVSSDRHNDDAETVMEDTPSPTSRSSSDSIIQQNQIIQSFRDDVFIEQFRQIVSEKVNLHHASWIRHAGLVKERMTTTSTATIRTEAPEKEASQCEASYCTDSTSKNEVEPITSTQNTHEEPKQHQEDQYPRMIWDEEHNINDIFLRLTAACGLSIRSHWKEFQHSCLNYINHLIYYPRCTNRFDSRTFCSRVTKTTGEHEYATTIAASDENENDVYSGILSLVKSHFSTDTLNILILGGGPVGLVLANALTRLQQEQSGEQDHGIPDVRIVILETRTSTIAQDQLGQKAPYTRDWMTDIPSKFLYDIIDPRITKFLMKLHQNKNDNKEGTRHQPNNIALPVNVIETLLLLSNRSNSRIKFIFENMELDTPKHSSQHQKLKTLLQKIPSSQKQNMIVFDATGHRLVKFDQVVKAAVLATSVKTKSTTQVTISDYKPDSKKTLNDIQELLRIRPSDIKLLRDSQKQLQIAQINTVSTNTNTSDINTNSDNSDNYGEHTTNSQDYLLHFAHGLTYPVLGDKGTKSIDDNSARSSSSLLPYKLYFMKILGFPLSPTIWSNLMKVQQEVVKTFPPLCVGSGGDSNGRDSLYRNWCGPHFMYEMSPNYRTDLYQLMRFASTPQGMSAAAKASGGDSLMTDCCGFAIRAVISNLTPQQAIGLQKIMLTMKKQHSWSSLSEEETYSKNEVPFSGIAVKDILDQSDILSINNIDRILTVLLENEMQRRPPKNPKEQTQAPLTQSETKLSVFEYQPYMYTDPLVPQHASQYLLGLDVPLIRIGDSLLSGDVNASTGLAKHLEMIHIWMKRLSEYYSGSDIIEAGVLGTNQ